LFLKLILKQCLKLKLAWCDVLPEIQQKQVLCWLADVNLMDGILFDRCFGGEKEGVSLHVFSDANKWCLVPGGLS